MLWRTGQAQWWIVDSAAETVQTVGWGQAGDVTAPGDYDGEGKADIGIWRGSEGRWYIIQSSDGETRVVAQGHAGDAPVACFSPSHYDPPAHAEIAANSMVTTTSNARRRSFQQRW